MKTLRVLVVISLLARCCSAFAEDLTPEKRADVEQLLQMTGAVSVGKQMGNAMVVQLTQTIKRVRPDIPQKVLDVLPEEVNAVLDAHADSLKELTILIYHKYFTASETKEMITFYSTDLGKKAIRVMPSLMQEGMAAGQEWGRALGPEIDARIRARFKKEGVNI